MSGTPVRLVAACLACFLVTASPAAADVLSGRVVGVADGDTLTVLDADKHQHRIRLNGIDAPETGQAFSEVAKQNLSSLVFGRDVSVVWVKADRYGRLVGTVTIASVNVNLEQLRAGLAWYYRDYAADVAAENQVLYSAAEAEARAAKRGLWRDISPLAPWVYRGELRPSTDSTSPPPTASTLKPHGLLGTVATSFEVRGNRSSKIYHVPGCRNYDDIAMRNRVIFKTEAEAMAAGYRKARNCG